MESNSSASKPLCPDMLGKTSEGMSTLTFGNAPKKPKLAPKPTPFILERSSSTPEPTGENWDTNFSPGHAPGYIQWKKAPAPDSENETEEERRSRVNKRHAPKGRRGTRCIDDGTIDRSSAIVGTPDPSKVCLQFKTEETDAYTNEMIKGEVSFQYGDDTKDLKIDWNNANSVKALNNWRTQVIRRTIGKTCDIKEFWTEHEQKLITGIISDYLNDEEKVIDWNQIACEYNAMVQGVQQKRGSLGAPRRYRCQSNDRQPREAICTSLPLRSDRQVPLRTASALHQEMHSFLATDAIEVMERLKSSGRPQRNAYPQMNYVRSKNEFARQSRSGMTSQEFVELHPESIESMDKSYRSAFRSPWSSTQTPTLFPLTQPRSLQPRSFASRQSTPEPPARRYKKRTIYNDEIIYDTEFTGIHTDINPNLIQQLGGSKSALALLAEQAANLYAQLPRSDEIAATSGSRLESSVPGVSGPILLEQGSNCPVVSAKNPCSSPAATMSTSYENFSRGSKPLSGRRSPPMIAHAAPVPTYGGIMVPIWTIKRKLNDEAAAKATSRTADIDSKKPISTEQTSSQTAPTAPGTSKPAF